MLMLCHDSLDIYHPTQARNEFRILHLIQREERLRRGRILLAVLQTLTYSQRLPVDDKTYMYDSSR